jgi:hypothetical protein
MASAIYPKAKESMLQGGINLSSGTVKAALVDTGTYTYSAAHDFYNDVSGVVGTPQTIGSKTFTNGLFDGADVTFTGVTGSSAEAIIIYIDTGTASTSALIAYIDSATGLPVTPNSGDISIAWNASGIFQL